MIEEERQAAVLKVDHDSEVENERLKKEASRLREEELRLNGLHREINRRSRQVGSVSGPASMVMRLRPGMGDAMKNLATPVQCHIIRATHKTVDQCLCLLLYVLQSKSSLKQGSSIQDSSSHSHACMKRDRSKVSFEL